MSIKIKVEIEYDTPELMKRFPISWIEEYLLQRNGYWFIKMKEIK